VPTGATRRGHSGRSRPPRAGATYVVRQASSASRISPMWTTCSKDRCAEWWRLGRPPS